MSVKINGTEELMKHLDSVQNVDSKLKRVIKTNTANLQGMAQRGATVDTGYMKSKITQSIKDGGMTGNVASEAPYSIHVEFGTFKQTAKPFMRPALNHVSPIFKTEITNAVKK